MPVRVVKLGGSLLDFDGLVPRLRAWLAAQPPMQSAMIVGGGSMADAVRDAFARHRLDEQSAHWLCVRLLGVTAELVHRLLPESELVTRWEAIGGGSGVESTGELMVGRASQPATWRRPGKAALQEGFSDGPCARLVLFDVEQFLREVEPRLAAVPLPHTWDVTSDSIAARVAELLGAEELVLLKSGLPSPRGDLAGWAASDYVDRYFPVAATRLARVRAVNLRLDPPPEAVTSPPEVEK